MEEIKLEEGESIRDSPFDLENDRVNEALQVSNISQQSETGNENHGVLLEEPESNENKAESNSFLRKEIIEEAKPEAKAPSFEEIKNNIRAIIKQVFTSTDLKRKTLNTLTKSITEALEMSLKGNNFEVFDEFFFDKYILMCNKKEPEILIECMDISQILFSENKIFELIERQKAPQRKFIDIINFLALFMELFSFTLYYLSLKRVLLKILDYLIGKGIL
jgi:hypothetical protein